MEKESHRPSQLYAGVKKMNKSMSTQMKHGIPKTEKGK